MRAKMGYLEIPVGTAKALFASDPVSSAFARTQPARGKHGKIGLHRNSITKTRLSYIPTLTNFAYSVLTISCGSIAMRSPRLPPFM